jgi:hypothetical protein
MRRPIVLSLLTLLSLSMAGCGFINNLLGRGDSEPVDQAGEADPTIPPELRGDGGTESFEEPLLPSLPTAGAFVISELIQSTNADERLKEINRDRPDPFALVAVPPPPRPAPPAPTQSPGGGGGGTTPPATPATPATSPTIPVSNGGGLPTLDPFPSLPLPTAASGIEISGVAQIGGQLYAIVQAPGEPTSRYVRVGDRLSGGAILVKRIETRPGSLPVVVLEENGVEIALPVGAGTTEPGAEAPTAALQPLITQTVATSGLEFPF